MDKRNFIEQAPAFYLIASDPALLEGKREVYTLE